MNNFTKDFAKLKKNDEVQNVIRQYERGLMTFSEALKLIARINWYSGVLPREEWPAW